MRVGSQHPDLVAGGRRARRASARSGVEVAHAVHGDREVRLPVAGSGGSGTSSPSSTVTPSRASWRSRTTSGRPAHGDRAVGHEDPRRRHRDVAARRAGPGTGAPDRGWSAASRRTRTARPAGRSRPGPGPPGRSRRAPGRRGGDAPPPRCRDEEPHGRAGDLEVLQRRRVPLVVVAVQQRLRRPAAQRRRRSSRRRSRRPATPEFRPRAPNGDDQVGGVAGDQHPPDPHPVDAPGSGSGRPTSTRSRRAGRRSTCRMRRSSPPEASSAARSKSGGHLPVDPERGVGAGVDQHLAAGVPLGVEVEPPLGLPARAGRCGCRRSGTGRRTSARRKSSPRAARTSSPRAPAQATA